MPGSRAGVEDDKVKKVLFLPLRSSQSHETNINRYFLLLIAYHKE
jgi:hypothetical protein